MPYAAITYRVRPGHEDAIADVFTGAGRVDAPEFHHDDGTRAGRLLGTAVFVKDDVMVRVIHYEGDIRALAAHMAGQPNVHQVEQQLAPYLAEQRDTGTPQGFADYFHNATMRCVSQLSIDDWATQQAGDR
jgi:hypothetical protein